MDKGKFITARIPEDMYFFIEEVSYKFGLTKSEIIRGALVGLTVALNISRNEKLRQAAEKYGCPVFYGDDGEIEIYQE